ncbi:Ni/Fe hydrogenase subunit alpha [Candidatus Nitrospira inopinata]|uniref:Sulfhydrogenase, subunit alpha n=1 Tax=Candidatus Nitrospira inopinata TaxID=1715989 RepID=A0A0S4KQE9_9BACT|nr:Ni/Fe hydrogenase subunit alpha [Candidatus Nitrospira inopinata]CUQ65561.1 Sulfhydrogenase, subunit alpha [Candidatus Nitrospira inopinata]
MSEESPVSQPANSTRTIAIGTIARVEGEGALRVTVKQGAVHDVELKIFEPPRFFEAFLQGRHYEEVPDIVARICGICPVAYQMSAVHAIERIFGLRVEGPLRDLRRLLYCGEWIESHALHVYLLHAPDFLGYESGIAMAKDHAAAVTRGLRIKKAGNALMTLLGGRSVHPVSVKVGGFSRVPSRRELEGLRDELLWARDAAIDTIRWVASFSYPDFVPDYTFVALRHDREYPFNEGRIVSSHGLDITADEFERHCEEQQAPYSTALHCRLHGAPYQVGPLARVNLNCDRLPPAVMEVWADVGLSLPLRNPFQGIVARSVEMLYALEEALRLIDLYEPPPVSSLPVTVKAGVGMACTEAPRGILCHRYRIDQHGVIREAKIVPPTSQNQGRIEEDLRLFLPRLLTESDDAIALACEKVIRCYDPCISCATHFLKLELQRDL